MNQTEIPKNCQDPENQNTLNLRDRSLSKPTSSVTVLKANVYQNFKEYTPRVQQSEKNSSSGKLIRVNSSKGINVLSSRPTSSEKVTKQFSATGTSFHGGSESTCKREHSSLLTQMREQLKKVHQTYENKMNQELSYQYNYMSIQIDRLKETNKVNETRLAIQKQQIDTLQNRINEVDGQTNEKITKLQEQLRDFKNYYDKCYQYSISRVNDIDEKMKVLYRLVETQTCPIKPALACQQVQKAYDILERMSGNFVTKTVMLRAEIKQQLFDLQIMIGNCSHRVDEIDVFAHEIKLVNFTNEAFCQNLKQAIHSNARLSSSKTPSKALKCDDDLFNNQTLYLKAEQACKGIKKRINACQIQIQMMNCLQKNNQEEQNARNNVSEQQVEEMRKIIDTLDKKIEEDKLWYAKQIKQKEEILTRINPRVIELEQRLKAAYELQAHLHKQVSQQNLKIAYLETKCSKMNEREFKTQSTLAEAFSETLVKEKTKQFEQEKLLLLRKINELEEKVAQMDRENYLLAEKYSQCQSSKDQVNKLTQEISFLTKLTGNFQKEKDLLLDQINESKIKILHLEKSNLEIKKQNETLLQHKKHISEQDQLYIDELEEEVEKSLNKIKSLETDNEDLTNKNKQLEEENKTLETNLHLYAETFEKQSINFRNAIEKLQKEKDYHTSENQFLQQENNLLKMDLEMSKSCQSFFEGSQVNFRKTSSTQLSSPKSVKKNEEKPKCKADLISSVPNLSKAIKDMQLPLPILCEIDETGYLKLESTSTYILDSKHNLFRLTEQQMKEAISLGLILL